MRVLGSIFLFLFLCSFLHAEPPYLLEPPEPIAPDHLTVSIGVQFRDEAQDFGIPFRDRQWNVPQIRLAFGLGGRAELRLEGEVLRSARIDGKSIEDAGDWTVSSKVRLWTARSNKMALGGTLAVKLPNAGDDRGLGTDETDTFISLMFRRELGEGRVMAQGTLGILGNPRVPAAQNDVARFSLGWHQPFKSGLLGLELDWQAGPAADDDPAYFHLGWTWNTDSKWKPYFGFDTGLTKEADDHALEFGLRRAFDLRAIFNRRQQKRSESYNSM